MRCWGPPCRSAHCPCVPPPISHLSAQALHSKLLKAGRLQGFAAAGAEVGDGSGLRAAMLAPDPAAWAADAQQLWEGMR